jgi:hypothetical protein
VSGESKVVPIQHIASFGFVFRRDVLFSKGRHYVMVARADPSPEGSRDYGF